MDGVVADDKEDGDITNKIVEDNGGFNPNKVGTYTVTYTITDKDSNVTTKQRTIVVYSKSTYLSDMNWESAKTGWRTVTKDTSVGSSAKIIGASLANALAIATRCCCPPESCNTFRFISSFVNPIFSKIGSGGNLLVNFTFSNGVI